MSACFLSLGYTVPQTEAPWAHTQYTYTPGQEASTQPARGQDLKFQQGWGSSAHHGGQSGRLFFLYNETILNLILRRKKSIKFYKTFSNNSLTEGPGSFLRHWIHFAPKCQGVITEPRAEGVSLTPTPQVSVWERLFQMHLTMGLAPCHEQ